MTNPPNYNSNTSGGLLEGIGNLLRGINSVRDPQAEQRARLQAILQSNPQLREQYQQQFANNPEGLKALLGKSPLFGKSNYEAVQNLITGGQVSPEAIRNQQINTLQFKDVANRNAGDISDATKRIPELANFSQATARGAVNSGLPMIDNDTQNLTEYNALGRFLTPAERQAQESRLAEQKANTDRAIVEANVAGKTAPARIAKDLADSNEAQARADELARINKARPLAQSAIAAMGKGENLYSNWKAGKISPDQYNAIQTVPEYARRFQEDLNATHQEAQLKQQANISEEMRQQRMEMRYNASMNQLMEKTSTAGMPLGADQALAIVKDPQSIMKSTDPSTQYIRDALSNMSNYYKKANAGEIAKTNLSFLNKSNSVITLANEGKMSLEDAVNQLNQESQLHYGGMPGINGPSFGIKTQENKHLGGLFSTHKDLIQITDPGNTGVGNKLGLSVTKDTGKAPPINYGPVPPGAYPKGTNPNPNAPGPASIGANGRPNSGANLQSQAPQVNVDALAQDAVDNDWDDSTIQAMLKNAGISDLGVLNQIRQAKLTKKKTKNLK